MDKSRIYRLLRATIAVLPLAALVVVATLTLRTSSAFGESSRLLRQAADIDLRLERMLSMLKDAETAQRGYLLTGQEHFLAPYTNALAHLPKSLPGLHTSLLTASDQDGEVVRLSALVARKLEQLAVTIQERKDGDTATAVAFVSSGRGQDLMDEIRGCAAALLRELEGNVDRSQNRLNAEVQFNAWLTLVIVVLICVLVAVAIKTLVRMQRLDRLVTICAWSRTIKIDDRWVTFEEYLRERFGIEVTHGISEQEYDRIMQRQVDPSEQKPPGPRRASSTHADATP